MILYVFLCEILLSSYCLILCLFLASVWHLVPNLNVLVVVSKSMQAVKLCSHKILHFLTRVQANTDYLHNGRKWLLLLFCLAQQAICLACVTLFFFFSVFNGQLPSLVISDSTGPIFTNFFGIGRAM